MLCGASSQTAARRWLSVYDNRYLYPVTVTGTGEGCVFADGKTLRVIGNLLVRLGDTVYTDGRIVYGHSPVRQNVNVPTSIKGIPYICYSGSYNGALSLHGTKVARVDNYQDYHSKPSNWCYTHKGNFYTYWMQSENPSAQKFDTDDSSFYLDMRVTDNAVYTAEYTNSDLPYRGLTAKPASKTRSDTSFYAVNFYLSEAGNYTPNNPQFIFNWLKPDYPSVGDGGRVYSNCGIRIRKNGQQTSMIDLSSYQFALDKIKDYYASNDIYDSKLKRYHYGAYAPRGSDNYYNDLDIMVADMLTQCLHFHFTDNAGNWEAIIFSMAEAMLSPHTVDLEKDKESEEEQMVEVQSVFSFDVPTVYYVMRVRSNAEPEVLQSHFIVRKYNNNLVTKKDWVNAQGYPVKEVNQKNINRFRINFDNCSLETDLRFIYDMKYGSTSIRDMGLYLRTFRYLVATDYNRINPYGGANNAFMTYDLYNNDAEFSMSTTPSHVGFISGNLSAYGVMRNTSIGRAYLNSDGNSYLGRMSVFPTNGKYIFSIYNNQLYVTDSSGKTLLSTAPYDYNMNLDVLSDVRKLKKPKTINDLVADVTKPKNS